MDVIKCITGWWKVVRSVYEGGERVVRLGFEGDSVLYLISKSKKMGKCRLY